MLPINELKTLMKTVVNANRSNPVAYSFNNENFSYKELDETLRQELNLLAGTFALYRENKNTIFALMEEVISDVVPKKVADRFMSFAETKVFPQGSKPIFTRKMGKMRAKQFVTRVGLAGVYEVFKLGGTSFEVETSALGGAAQIGFEEYLDGRVDFNELVQVIVDGIEEAIYHEVAAALIGSIEQLPEANRVSTNGFDEVAMDRLVQIASAYGNPAIYCTREFAVKMIPQEAWASSEMKNTLWTTGYLPTYKGISVIILEQSYTDETNATKVIDPGYAYIMPTGGEKPVAIAIEGTTHMREVENYDWSRDIHTYQKVGVAVRLTNNICIYTDTDLAGKLDTIGA